MLSRPLALLRRDRRAQAGAAAFAIAGLAFGWWTISPLFIATTVVETDIAATVTVVPATTAPAVTATGTATAAPTPAGPVARLIGRGELQRIDDLHQGRGPVVLFELEGRHIVRFEDVVIQNGPDLHVYLGRGSADAFSGPR